MPRTLLNIRFRRFIFISFLLFDWQIIFTLSAFRLIGVTLRTTGSIFVAVSNEIYEVYVISIGLNGYRFCRLWEEHTMI